MSFNPQETLLKLSPNSDHQWSGECLCESCCIRKASEAFDALQDKPDVIRKYYKNPSVNASEKLRETKEKASRYASALVKLKAVYDAKVARHTALEMRFSMLEIQYQKKVNECVSLIDRNVAQSQTIGELNAKNANILAEQKSAAVELVALKKIARAMRTRVTDQIDTYFDIVMQVGEPTAKKSRIDDNQED